MGAAARCGSARLVRVIINRRISSVYNLWFGASLGLIMMPTGSKLQTSEDNWERKLFQPGDRPARREAN